MWLNIIALKQESLNNNMRIFQPTIQPTVPFDTDCIMDVYVLLIFMEIIADIGIQ